MTNFEAYNAQKADSGTIWILFLLLGWSYGSMDQMGKQILYYLTLGGFGVWCVYRLLTLNNAIKKYNKSVAIKCNMGMEEMVKLNLI